MTDVPCNGCTACCRGQLVVICEVDGDPAQWDTISIAEAGSAGVLANEMMLGLGELRVLRQTEDEACVYLGENGCSIYERRPAMCREFDCRKMALSVLSGKLPGDPFHPCIKAGIERLGSL